MPEHDSDRKRARRALILALVALTLVSSAVCGGAYLIYEEGGLSGILGARASQPMVLATITSSATPAPSIVAGSPTESLVAARSRLPDDGRATPSQETVEAPARTPSKVPTPAPTATPTWTPDPWAGTFTIEYRGCATPGASALKGRVLDVDGQPIVEARVYLTLDEWPYDIPAASNGEGWYEFYLTTGQMARIVRLVIGGVDRTLADSAEYAFEITGNCFQHIDLQEH